ncbi:MAG TPA: mycothione reductase [Ilumatobacteraceae bacterium]|nr:mycothione reductase [Ilumatobacteraceae bacterium]
MTIERYDLIIIGTGSGNSVINDEMDGWRIAIIERWVFGGTCLNRGCIPSKILVYAADVAESAARDNGPRYGVTTRFEGADWPAMVRRTFAHIDPVVEGGRQYRLGLPNVTVYEGDARFVGERTLEVNGTIIAGERIVIATGARPFIPDVAGIDEVPYETSDTIMRITHQPKHLVVLGGGFIAAELGHVFRSLGSRVTIVNRSHRLLTAEDGDICSRYTELVAERFDLVLGAHVNKVYMTAAGIGMHVTADDSERTVEGDTLLVAAGRLPNGDQIDAEKAGVEIGAMGQVIVDEYGRTTAPGVWALGDVNGRYQLKHMANGEAKVVQHNLLHPDELQKLDTRPAPHAVFGSPQVGAVGMTEAQAESSGRRYTVARHSYSGAAYGWALEDTSGFCKLIGDPVSRTLLGAHVIGYQASVLVQLLVQGIHLGNTVDQMATGQIWIHPALSEVVEQALLNLVEAFDRA